MRSVDTIHTRVFVCVRRSTLQWSLSLPCTFVGNYIIFWAGLFQIVSGYDVVYSSWRLREVHERSLLHLLSRMHYLSLTMMMYYNNRIYLAFICEELYFSHARLPMRSSQCQGLVCHCRSCTLLAEQHVRGGLSIKQKQRLSNSIV